jgi:hypothetical protein
MEYNGSISYNSRYRWHNWWNTNYPIRPASPYSVETEEKIEFSIDHHYNNLGFKGKDILAKETGEYRIVALGDSFTEGAAAPDGYSWPEQLHKMCSSADSNINVINLGKSGNDPVFEYKALKDTFIKLQPNMVLLAINGSDISEIITRGNLVQRFYKNGTTHLKKGPWWEFFYAYSYIVRNFIHGVFGFDHLFISKKDYRNNKDPFCDAAKDLADCLQETYLYCSSKKINFYVVFIPEQYEMEMRSFGKCLGNTYNICKTNNIPLVFLPTLYENKGMNNENAYKYYWTNDKHHNQIGYELLAQCVFETIKQDITTNNK